MPEVKFTEKELEDYLSSKKLDEYFHMDFIARQVKTDSGPLDILAYQPHIKTWFIIELKAGPITKDAFVQADRYYQYFKSKYRHKNRKFVKILVGDCLDKSLIYNVYKYHPLTAQEAFDGMTLYSLYGWDFEYGIEFNYFSKSQGEVERSRNGY